MTETLAVSARGGGARFDIRVVPRAGRDAVGGLRDGRLIVRVTAPPVDEAANDAVVRLLAARLSVPRGSIRIVSGERSRNKTVEVTGLGEAVVRERMTQNG